MSELEELTTQYLAACKDVQSVYRGMSEEQLNAHPVEGKWSAMEVLCHLVDTDLTTAFRIRAALVSNSPRLQAFTVPELTKIPGVDVRDAAEEMTCFQTIRSQTARILRSMPPDILDRQVVLLKAGNEEALRTVRELLTGITSHVKHHLAFVVEKRRALGLV